MTQSTDINEINVKLAEQGVVLRETKHLLANLVQKIEALTEKVIGMAPLAGDVADLKIRVAALEAWKSKQEGAIGLGAALVKAIPWAAGGATFAILAKLLGVMP